MQYISIRSLYTNIELVSEHILYADADGDGDADANEYNQTFR